MRCSTLMGAGMGLLGCVMVQFALAVEQSDIAVMPPDTVGPTEACKDFAMGHSSGLPWTLEDCVEVWAQFTDTIPLELQPRSQLVDIWRDTAAELRRLGRPCLAASKPTGDGVGSSTIRLLASWIFAEEMGCDWVTPDWGREHFDGGNGTEVIMYCHKTAIAQDKAMFGPSSKTENQLRCTAVDWLGYFQFGVPSVDLPDEGTPKIIPIGRHVAKRVEAQTLELRKDGLANQEWDYVMFTFRGIIASENLCSVGNWDEPKRATTRKVLGEARNNFHAQSRLIDKSSYCAYKPTSLNFALHVRMGDRRASEATDTDYFHILEVFMDIVSTEVVRMGLDPPLFHVFSETLVPCPSADAGLFDEFPTWPVDLAQLPECLEAIVPDDCPEKRLMPDQDCKSERSGIFYVLGKPLVLHVGSDVSNAMSCMIEADGLLMGCSTFGQMAGLLTRGISFFSMHCEDDRTPTHYRTIPPLAVAERGHMWVPVSGSWRDPALLSTEPLRRALLSLLESRSV